MVILCISECQPLLTPQTSAPFWKQKGQKLLITGTIFKRDGRTPAPNVILYYYHTDINGLYANKKGLDKKSSPAWLYT